MAAVRLSEREIERRLPVWAALSELFLDTAMDEAARARIARSVSTAGFSAEEATRILEREVAPVFHGNLLSPAAEWSGWAEAEVRRMVLAHLCAPPWRRWPAIALAHATRGFYRSEWRFIRARLPRGGLPGGREGHRAA